MFTKFNKQKKLAGLAALIAVGMVPMAHAGTTGAEFQDAYTMLTEWINGYFGRALAIAFLLVGLFMGIARQNLMACGVSIAVAFGLIITPTILDNILAATISGETAVIEAPAAVEVPMIVNGQPG
ncbi:TraA family conjugative transfer protein [Paracoccus sp. T5]|uniref:TraA family conjugative transfer protein n=1 Tax=Paracoccus sp. T5 TaxID=3402161 RepID=UPI003AE9B5C4